PRACRPLIRHMLEPDPRLRWTVEEVWAHEWVQGISLLDAGLETSDLFFCGADDKVDGIEVGWLCLAADELLYQERVPVCLGETMICDKVDLPLPFARRDDPCTTTQRPGANADKATA
ncbi:hypothetical protein FISHEDRAFT_58571, partial [Fistulina hepatica ATCC 64428]